jgi:hypothetical protein
MELDEDIYFIKKKTKWYMHNLYLAYMHDLYGKQI